MNTGKDEIAVLMKLYLRFTRKLSAGGYMLVERRITQQNCTCVDKSFLAVVLFKASSGKS